ncbi:MAG TPA: hypothetical protein PLI71_09730 [Clostridia bacterium]|nr:hypothetical protein [Clostridia bacterium]
MPDPTPFQIVIDTREQRPYSFPDAIRGTLPTGDYSFVGGEKLFAIERKSLQDAWGSIAQGHDRFRREMERATSLLDFQIVVEGEPDLFVCPELEWRRVHPNSLRGTVYHWRKKYGVYWIFRKNREEAKKYIEWRLRSWWQEWRAGLWNFLPVELLDLSPWNFTRDKIRFAKSRIKEVK